MFFWLAAAALTFVACLAVLAPLARRRPAPTAAAREHDLTVYRDQIAEIERDRDRGLIGAAEAEEARTEIGRRMLKLAGAGSATPTGSGRAGRAVAAACVLAVPLVAWGGYAAVGMPGMPDAPLAARLESVPADSIEALLARAEQHLSGNPRDGRGWDVVAPVYLRLGRYQDAEAAFASAIRINGSSAARELGLGEAVAGRAGGQVTTVAQAAFERALAFDAAEPRARFYLALAKAQEGRRDEAVAEWQTLLAGLPDGSPWRSAVEDAMRAAQAPQTPGPTAEDVESASELGEADRAAMIEGMVARLDARLRAEPGDEEGWMRLIRSYRTLGRMDAAQDALARAKLALAGDAGAGSRIDAFAAELGVAGSVRQ